jgi:hypothetical protein
MIVSIQYAWKAKSHPLILAWALLLPPPHLSQRLPWIPIAVQPPAHQILDILSHEPFADVTSELPPPVTTLALKTGQNKIKR